MAKKAKVEIIAADEGSAENELGFTAEEAEILALPNASPASWSEGDVNSIDFGEQSPESAALDADIAAGDGSRIAVIPVVDRIVDAPRVQQPIDIRIGGMHIKNPG
jgi:hypothetical protein